MILHKSASKTLPVFSPGGQKCKPYEKKKKKKKREREREVGGKQKKIE